MPIPNLTPTEIAPFWSKVDRSGSSAACWEWQGAPNAYGYGRLLIRGIRLVQYVRASCETNVAIAECFGVSDATISYARGGKTWKTNAKRENKCPRSAKP